MRVMESYAAVNSPANPVLDRAVVWLDRAVVCGAAGGRAAGRVGWMAFSVVFNRFAAG